MTVRDRFNDYTMLGERSRVDTAPLHERKRILTSGRPIFGPGDVQVVEHGRPECPDLRAPPNAGSVVTRRWVRRA